MCGNVQTMDDSVCHCAEGDAGTLVIAAEVAEEENCAVVVSRLGSEMRGGVTCYG